MVLSGLLLSTTLAACAVGSDYTPESYLSEAHHLPFLTEISRIDAADRSESERKFWVPDESDRSNC